MRHLKTTLAVLGAVTILVLAGNTISMAATGKAFILGKGNSANKQTTLSRTTNGPVLKLNAKTSTGVPMAVKGSGKVTNLNADKVDGFEATALRTTTAEFSRVVSSAANQVASVIPLAPGTYVVGYSAYLNGSTPDNGVANCEITRNRSGNYTFYAGDRATTKAGFPPSFSGSAVITVASGDVVQLYCQAQWVWTTTSSEPLRVYATRTSLASSSTMVDPD